MLQVLIECALRSLALGLTAGLALRLLRIRNPHTLMMVWAVVLMVSMAMPGLTPWMRLSVPIKELRAPAMQSLASQLSWTSPVSRDSNRELQPRFAPPQISTVHWQVWLVRVYLLVGGVLTGRLLLGLWLMRRIVRRAIPLPRDPVARANLRLSHAVSVPVTFASTILLPSASVDWSASKRRAVLLHEGSHTAHGDFYVLLLASIHRVLFWFNPFTWWLYHRLAYLTEVISDEAAIAGLGNRQLYADILFEMAVNAQRIPTGLRMAHPRTVQRRVRRIFSLHSVAAPSTWRTRTASAIALAPLASISALTLVPHTADALREAASHASAFVGQFQVSATSILRITQHGQQLMARLTGQPITPLIVAGDNAFATPAGDTHLSFVTDGSSPADAVIVHKAHSSPLHAPRIDTARAEEIEGVIEHRFALAPQRFKDQVPLPGSQAALRTIIDQLARNAFDAGAVSETLSGKVAAQPALYHDVIEQFGQVQSVTFQGVGPGGYDIYQVQFANGMAQFKIYLAANGVIEDVNFHADGDATPGGTATCQDESTLNSPRDTAPIKLSLTNHSGGDLQLFWLDFAGQRVARGQLPDNAQRQFTTNAARPFVIADLSGHCREIIVAGRLTRFHVIEPTDSPTPPPSASARTEAHAGSEQALRQYIEDLQRGAPNYDRVAPGAAAAIRELAPRQRAALSTLGALRSIAFSGVSPEDTDIYAVQFANGASRWQIGLANGRIASVTLGPP